MKCTSCGSERLELIRVFGGAHQLGWSPVSGEKDIFGNYKKLRPLLAHGCMECGNVMWNIKIEKPQDPDKTAAALDELATEQAEFDPGQESAEYSFEFDLDEELA